MWNQCVVSDWLLVIMSVLQVTSTWRFVPQKYNFLKIVLLIFANVIYSILLDLVNLLIFNLQFTVSLNFNKFISKIYTCTVSFSNSKKLWGKNNRKSN